MRHTKEDLSAKDCKVPLDDYLVLICNKYGYHDVLDMLARAIVYTGDNYSMPLADRVQDVYHDFQDWRNRKLDAHKKRMEEYEKTHHIDPNDPFNCLGSRNSTLE